METCDVDPSGCHVGMKRIMVKEGLGTLKGM
jgi:hypothetical protein